MQWFQDLFWNNSVAHTVLIYSIVIAAGVALGKIKVWGVSLGITLVLFVGILAGHLGLIINEEVLDFTKDFGLILFVFTIGLQVGPGFFSSFRKGGLAFNLLAMTIVVLNVGMTVFVHYIARISMPMAVGILSGAVTNTPGLGAAQQALGQIQVMHPGTEVPQISLGYAVAYPFGVLGIILSMMVIKRIFRLNPAGELEILTRRSGMEKQKPQHFNLVVRNPQIVGKKIGDLHEALNCEFVISRICHDQKVSIPGAETVLHEGDLLLIIGSAKDAKKINMLIGEESGIKLNEMPSSLVSRRILVTKDHLNGKTISALKLRSVYEVNITRVNRAGVEFLASNNLALQVGDKLTVVGQEDAVMNVATLLGNSMKRLDEPNIVPIFIGILLGVLVGSIPFRFAGIPMPVRLGLAGGPLIVAILLSRYGYRFSLVSYTTHSANLMLREIGIVLFLASVGLKAGGSFVDTLVSGDGLSWMGWGFLITIIPLLIVGSVARIFLRKNYLEICGLLAGSTTDPPALAYANSIVNSDAPSVTYATVYPLVMFLRVLSAQLLILLFA